MNRKSMFLSLNLMLGDVRNYYHKKCDYYTQRAAETENPRLKARFQRRADIAYAMHNGGAFWDLILIDELSRVCLTASSRIARV